MKNSESFFGIYCPLSKYNTIKYDDLKNAFASLNKKSLEKIKERKCSIVSFEVGMKRETRKITIAYFINVKE